MLNGFPGRDRIIVLRQAFPVYPGSGTTEPAPVPVWEGPPVSILIIIAAALIAVSDNDMPKRK